jgi:hypothetical protein
MQRLLKTNGLLPRQARASPAPPAHPYRGTRYNQGVDADAAMIALAGSLSGRRASWTGQVCPLLDCRP